MRQLHYVFVFFTFPNITLTKKERQYKTPLKAAKNTVVLLLFRN